MPTIFKMPNKAEMLEQYNESGAYEILLVAHHFTPYKKAKQAEILDVFQEGVLFKLTMATEELEYFLNFAPASGQPLLDMQKIFIELQHQLDKDFKSDCKRQFKVLDKQTWQNNFVRLTLTSQQELHQMSPGYLAAFELDERTSRAFTYRRMNTDRNQIEVDIFIHGTSPSTAWLDSLNLGDDVYTVKERTESLLSFSHGQIIICGDETAYPTIAAILEQWSNPKPPIVLLETINIDCNYFDDCEIPDFTQMYIYEVSNIKSYGDDTADFLQKFDNKITGIWNASSSEAMKKIRKVILSKHSYLEPEQCILKVYWNNKNK